MCVSSGSLLGFLVVLWVSEIGGAFPADGVGSAPPLWVHEYTAALGTSRASSARALAQALASQRGFASPRSLRLLIQQVPCKALRGNS